MQLQTNQNNINNDIDQVEAEKVRALQSHLNLNNDEVNEITLEDGELYHINGNEYKVLTDEEADEQAKEYIEESVWAFNPSFYQLILKMELMKMYLKPYLRSVKAQMKLLNL